MRDPFDFLVVPDALGVAAQSAVHGDYPTIESAADRHAHHHHGAQILRAHRWQHSHRPQGKRLTVLLYFNPQWTSPEGRLRLLRLSDNLEDYAAEVVPVAGTLIAFRRTDHSWHGHSRYVGERRMVPLNYLDASPWAVLRQRASRLSTHFMKEVLHIR